MTRSLDFAIRALARDWRSGELAVLLVALLVAVMAMTAVAFFTDRVGKAVGRQASEVLAADLVLRSGRPIDESIYTEARAFGLETARKLSFPSVVLAGDSSALADIDGVTAAYPLRGTLRVTDAPFVPGVPTDAIPAPGEAWADARLLARLGADRGVELEVGATTLTVTRILDFAPDRGWQFSDFAPALLVNLADVPATELVQPGSRVYHYALFAGAEADVAAFKAAIAARLAPGEKLRDLADTRPEIRSALEHARRFLGLSALVSALLAAIAVGMAGRRYATRHLDTVALMKCMGASQALITRMTLLQLLALAVVAGLGGALLGYMSQLALTAILRDLIGTTLPPPSLRPAAIGLATAFVLLAGFAMPPLLRLRQVPPARVLRRDMGPPPPAIAVAYGSAALAVSAMLFALVRDPRLVTYVLAGAGFSVALLWVTGWLLVQATTRVRGGVGVSWRYGVANIARRGGDSILQIVAFGLGLMALLLLTVVRTDLLDTWQATLPKDAPNHFLINIQPDETDGVRDLLAAGVGSPPTLVPLVRARLSQINGRTVRELGLGERAERWVERESNLSWSSTLTAGNRIVAGRWWDDPDTAGGQVSVERDFAADLGLELGDALSFDIAGEEVRARVTSFREVKWDSFQPNFFMVFAPGLLEEYPATFITSVYLPDDQRGLLLTLLREFPSVTSIDMNAVFQQVRGVMDKAAMAVQYVFLFTLLAGLTVLLAAVQATRDERLYEGAMLRALGATRGVVTRGLAAEFGVLGMLAGLLGAVGAGAAGYVLATQVFELDYVPGIGLWGAGMLAGTLIVGVSGVLATRGVVNRSPVATLRAL